MAFHVVYLLFIAEAATVPEGRAFQGVRNAYFSIGLIDRWTLFSGDAPVGRQVTAIYRDDKGVEQSRMILRDRTPPKFFSWDPHFQTWLSFLRSTVYDDNRLSIVMAPWLCAKRTDAHWILIENKAVERPALRPEHKLIRSLYRFNENTFDYPEINCRVKLDDGLSYRYVAPDKVDL